MTINWSVVNTIGRYALTAAGSAIAVLGAVGLMSQTSAATATEAIKNLSTALGTIATSLATLAGIGATVYAGVRGALHSTQAGTAAAVQALADDPTSPVKPLVVENNLAGRDLQKTVPGIVIAGTPAAAQIAK